MATSGSVDFSVTRNELIETAMKTAGVIGEGETPNATQLSEVAILLNMIVKARMSDGMPLWALKTGYILPVTGTSQVLLGAGGGHATASYVSTTTSAAASSGASTITVTSATGIANGYYIGIEQSDSTMHWTTVSGAPSGTTVTLTAVTTASVASGATVYCYQTKLQRPLRIIDAYCLYTTSSARNPITVIAKDDYWRLGNLTSTGTPVQIYYDPQLDNGIFYVYPRFTGGENVIQITFHRPFEDFDAANDTPDFPQEWYLAIMAELAYWCGIKYGVGLEERAALKNVHQETLAQALSNGSEQSSLRFVPDYRGGR